MKVAIVKYNAGNIYSVDCALRRVGVEAEITDNKEIEDRFYKELEFGTGGLRGVIGAGTRRGGVNDALFEKK